MWSSFPLFNLTVRISLLRNALIHYTLSVKFLFLCFSKLGKCSFSSGHGLYPCCYCLLLSWLGQCHYDYNATSWDQYHSLPALSLCDNIKMSLVRHLELVDEIAQLPMIGVKPVLHSFCSFSFVPLIL